MRPGDVVRLNGEPYVAMSIQWRGVELETLAQTLTTYVAIGKDSIRLYDLLVEAGWEPPLDDQRVTMVAS